MQCCILDKVKNKLPKIKPPGEIFTVVKKCDNYPISFHIIDINVALK